MPHLCVWMVCLPSDQLESCLLPSSCWDSLQMPYVILNIAPAPTTLNTNISTLVCKQHSLYVLICVAKLLKDALSWEWQHKAWIRQNRCILGTNIQRYVQRTLKIWQLKNVLDAPGDPLMLPPLLMDHITFFGAFSFLLFQWWFFLNVVTLADSLAVMPLALPIQHLAHWLALKNSQTSVGGLWRLASPLDNR